MTAKEYCTSHDAIAYYSGLSGLEIHGIEYGVDDYVYCASGAWVGKYSYHRVKVLYSAKGDAYIRFTILFLIFSFLNTNLTPCIV